MTTFVSRVAEMHDSLKTHLSEHAAAVQQQQALLKQLQATKAKEQQALQSVSATLAALKGTKMTLSALQSTQVGVTVNKLRKSEVQTVAAASSELIRSWKGVADSGGRGMEADGTVDRSGKSPTKSPVKVVSDDERRALSIAKLQDRYAKIDEQKASRKIHELSDREAGALCKKMRRR